MQEGVLHIQLMNKPATSECQREDCPDGSGLHDRTESLCKIHARTLGESPEDRAGLVTLESPISIELVLEDPLSSDDIGSWRARHKIPGVVL